MLGWGRTRAAGLTVALLFASGVVGVLGLPEQSIAAGTSCQPFTDEPDVYGTNLWQGTQPELNEGLSAQITVPPLAGLCPSTDYHNFTSAWTGVFGSHAWIQIGIRRNYGDTC